MSRANGKPLIGASRQLVCGFTQSNIRSNLILASLLSKAWFQSKSAISPRPSAATTTTTATTTTAKASDSLCIYEDVILIHGDLLSLRYNWTRARELACVRARACVGACEEVE